ncbi:hypothetical protein IMZ31_21735 (plasmid) [Pontibacillus sp. ALD_SL1]|uniref:hypothetical protein n=1 Tax=Pontibacillus sp. ALD_SL1 TaxID=2777185 RepID=UPI001A95742C|nr:hypothetical protein [Pontibacillus sp. ALD_SL1]QST02074.1 hypothetical protein IMZ31_21735 [Pontibacillus sp. ALD_SL1]
MKTNISSYTNKEQVEKDLKRMGYGIHIDLCKVMTEFNLLTIEERRSILTDHLRFQPSFVKDVFYAYGNRPNELNQLLESKPLRIEYDRLYLNRDTSVSV